MICHNVEPHEPVPLGRGLTRSVLRHADLLVVHAAQQRRRARARSGSATAPILDAFHPRFAADDLCARPAAAQVAAERARQGDPELSLLAFGAIRPYKGIDLALEALAELRAAQLHVRLTVAGVFWDGGEELRAARRRSRDRAIASSCATDSSPTRRPALLFAASDASLLPYRSATQSGVVQLSFAYGVPVIATAVGGLVEAVATAPTGSSARPGDGGALCARDRAHGRASAHGWRRASAAPAREHSFRRYGELLHARSSRCRPRAPALTAVAPAAIHTGAAA